MALVPGPGLRARVHNPAGGRGGARRGGWRRRIRVPLCQPADRPARPRPEPAGRPGLRGRRRGRDPAAAPLGPADGARPGAAVRHGRRRRLAWRAPVPAPDAVRRDGPRVRPRGRLLRVHAAGDRGRDRSRHRRHDAHAARHHRAVRGAPGHRRVPPAGHGGAVGPPAPGGANRPALRAGSVAGVLRPTSGTVVLHHRAARGGELRRSPRPAHRPAARPAPGEARLTERDIRANRPTIDNVRLWDRDPLLQTFGQLQEIRTYYDFVSVDDDRYWIDGQYRQVLLSPRELNSGSLPTRTFINERLTFTHGMGLTLGPVNQVTSEGLPVLFIKDLPPASSVSLRVTRPELYFGELTDSWVFARTHQREFDYPSGDENIFTSYTGTGGVRVGSFLRRLVLATYLRSLKVLLSSDITSDSRAMDFRNIRLRARTALPFLLFDDDPYLVVSDSGRLRWMLDAYTATSRYSFAQPLDNGLNYMRHSVKVVIDAFDGTVTAYLADPRDPLVRTLAKVFPGIFQPLDAMSADLRAHLRYPEDLFRVQTDMYATYHMAEPEIFYHREDQWQKPVLSRPGERPDAL